MTPPILETARHMNEYLQHCCEEKYFRHLDTRSQPSHQFIPCILSSAYPTVQIRSFRSTVLSFPFQPAMELVQQPSGLGWALVAVLLSWVSITTITIVLRFYVQLRMLKRPAGWEECFAGVGWILFLVYAGIAIASAFYGIGHHLFPMPPPGFWMTLKVRVQESSPIKD